MSPAAPSGLSRSPRRFRRQIDELHDLVRAAALHGSDADALAASVRCIPPERPIGSRSSTPSFTSCITLIPSRTVCAALLVPTAACRTRYTIRRISKMWRSWCSSPGQQSKRATGGVSPRLRRPPYALRWSGRRHVPCVPSYPRRYREAVAGLPLPVDIQNAPVERIVDTSGRVFADDDLQLREFTGHSARLLESYSAEIAA